MFHIWFIFRNILNNITNSLISKIISMQCHYYYYNNFGDSLVSLHMLQCKWCTYYIGYLIRTELTTDLMLMYFQGGCMSAVGGV